MQLSVVMPAKNEAARLPATLAALAASDLPRRYRLEVVVVDDGSTDATARLAQHPELEVRVVRRQRSTGVAAAVKAGVLSARGERILVCDADGAVPFDDLHPLWEALDHGFHVAVGSRSLGRIEVAQPARRILAGKLWGRLVKLLVPTGVADTQCGFKLFEQKSAHRLFTTSRCKSFAFYVELLALAAAQGLLVAEVPVRWRDVPGSKIRLTHDPFAMSLELLGVAWRTRRGDAAVGRFIGGDSEAAEPVVMAARRSLG